MVELVDRSKEGPLLYLDAGTLTTTKTVRAAGYRDPTRLLVPNHNEARYVARMQRAAETMATVFACRCFAPPCSTVLTHWCTALES